MKKEEHPIFVKYLTYWSSSRAATWVVYGWCWFVDLPRYEHRCRSRVSKNGT